MILYLVNCYTMVVSDMKWEYWIYAQDFDYVDLYILTMDFNQEMELDFRPKNGHDAYSVYFLMMRLLLIEMISQLACI